MRKIKVRRLLVSGLVYRLFIILVESITLKVITGQWKWAIGTSLILNVVSLCAYYIYHYWFARLVKLGVNNK
jgi:hypothetical protein